MVAAGILLSRILGLVRNRVFAHYFGTSAAADAFNAAFKLPNFLQNLFGEGVLSASFIPVYVRLQQQDRDEARRVAVAVGGLLALATSIVVLLGVLLTPVLVTVFTPGFDGEKREATIRLARIFFPGPVSWSSRPGASASSTATGASFSPTPHRLSGTWRSSAHCSPLAIRLRGIGLLRSRRGDRWQGAPSSLESSCPPFSGYSAG